MSESNPAEVVLHHEVTVTGVFLTRDGESSYTEKFIVSVENAEKALVDILTRETDSLKARLSKLSPNFRGIRTHIVASQSEVRGVPPPPPAPEPVAVDPRDAQIAELQDEVAALKAQIVSLTAEAPATVAASSDVAHS